MLASSQQDAEWLLDSLVDLRMVAGQFDRAELRDGLQDIIQDYARMPLRDWSLGEAFARVTRVGHGHMRVPHHLLVLMRAIFLMESSVRKLDPQFNLIERLFARGTELLHRSNTEMHGNFDRLKFEAVLLWRSGPRDFGQLVHGMRVALQSRPWERSSSGPERDHRRVASAILAAGMYLASTWVLTAGVGPLLFGVPILAVAGLSAAVVFSARCMGGQRS